VNVKLDSVVCCGFTVTCAELLPSFFMQGDDSVGARRQSLNLKVPFVVADRIERIGGYVDKGNSSTDGCLHRTGSISFRLSERLPRCSAHRRFEKYRTVHCLRLVGAGCTLCIVGSLFAELPPAARPSHR